MLMTVAKFQARPEARLKLLELALALVEPSRVETGGFFGVRLLSGHHER